MVVMVITDILPTLYLFVSRVRTKTLFMDGSYSWYHFNYVKHFLLGSSFSVFNSILPLFFKHCCFSRLISEQTLNLFVFVPLHTSVCLLMKGKLILNQLPVNNYD